jgi:transcription elongation factor Elf1
MKIKYSDYIKYEKLRKFKRMPKLLGKRNPVPFTCPSCSKEGMTSTSYEVTGN